MTPIVPVAITPGRTVSCAEVTPRSDAVSVTRVKESMMAEEEQEERFVSRLGQTSGGVKDARGKGSLGTGIARSLFIVHLANNLAADLAVLDVLALAQPKSRQTRRRGAYIRRRPSNAQYIDALLIFRQSSRSERGRRRTTSSGITTCCAAGHTAIRTRLCHEDVHCLGGTIT